MKQFLVIATLFLLCGCVAFEDLGRAVEKYQFPQHPDTPPMRTDEEKDRDREHRAAKQAETEKKWEDRTMSAQQMLNSLGYECGEPTGVIDEQTRIAVIDYQYDHALETTGWIDDPLVRHLENTIADH